MPKPIQITSHEDVLYVLLDDGRIFSRWDTKDWREVEGPWKHERTTWRCCSIGPSPGYNMAFEEGCDA